MSINIEPVFGHSTRTIPFELDKVQGWIGSIYYSNIGGFYDETKRFEMLDRFNRAFSEISDPKDPRYTFSPTSFMVDIEITAEG